MKRFWVALILAGALAGCAANQGNETAQPGLSPVPTTSAAATGGPPLISTSASTPAVPPAATSPQAFSTAAPAVSPTATTAPVAQAPDPTGAPTAPPAAAVTRVASPQGAISLPAGFGISVFAAGLASPRNMALGLDGQLYVAERGAGRIVRLADLNRDGLADGVQVVADGFSRPSSLAFYRDGSLYVSTATQVFRLSRPDASGVYQTRDLVIDGLPDGGHFTRTLLFSPDWSSLFIQVGSSCNTCVESDSRRGTIMRFNPDGSGGAIYTRGLRNAVGLTFRPGTNELWATNNGSDNLGDNRPPDTLQIVQQGEDYGWPRCHAGTIPDPQFGGPSACSGIAAPALDLQAHSAALGLTFYTGKQFPSEYQGDLFVALHGSIYRSVPTGYKVVRIHFTNGRPGPAQDFAAGWLTDSGRAWGRPVDVLTAADGSLFVSDDSGGIVYRIFFKG